MSSLLVAETAARQVLALVFLVAGVTKRLDPEAAADAVRAYEVVPSNLAGLTAGILTWLELGLAGYLLFGLLKSTAFLVSTALFLVFILAQVSILLRGKEVSCGCFGSKDDVITGRTLLRTAGFLALAFVGLYGNWMIDSPSTEARLPPPPNQRHLLELVLIQLGVTTLVGLYLAVRQAAANDALAYQSAVRGVRSPARGLSVKEGSA